MWLRLKFTTANAKGSSNMWLPNEDFSGMHTELEARGTYRNRDTYTQKVLEILVHTVHILTIAFFSSSQIYRQADLVYCDIVPQNMQNIFCACFFLSLLIFMRWVCHCVFSKPMLLPLCIDSFFEFVNIHCQPPFFVIFSVDDYDVFVVVGVTSCCCQALYYEYSSSAIPKNCTKRLQAALSSVFFNLFFCFCFWFGDGACVFLCVCVWVPFVTVKQIA